MKCDDRHPLGVLCEGDEHVDDDGRVDGLHFKYVSFDGADGAAILTLIQWTDAIS